MKRIIFTSLVALLAGVFSQAHAQYQDDIYGGSTPATTQESTNDEGQQQADESNQRRDEAPVYSSDEGSRQSSSPGSNWGNTREYQDEYSNYDDDYYYSTRLNRFYHPFYNRPYWSGFYNPNWYDPYWVDPYMGWSPWTPGISISFGYGPYWSSYWGYSSWYGCSAFGSYYGYPYYGFGGYYSGYWNGYYAGLYNHYGDAYIPRQTVTYGPRYNLRPRQTSGLGLGNSGTNTFRMAPASSSRPVMSSNESPRSNVFGNRSAPRASEARNEAIRSNEAETPVRRNERPVRNGWAETPAMRNEDARPAATPAPAQPERGSWNEQSQQRRPDMPQRPAAAPAPAPRNYSRPQPAPRNESFPSRGFDRGGGSNFERGGSNFGGGRSFGGSNNSGGGSRGGFGGGRRR